MKKKYTIFEKIISSFDNSPDGFSARKLSAFVGVIIATYSTVYYVDGTTVINALMVWLTFTLLCLGIITAEQMLRFYKKDGDSPVVPSPDDKKEQENPIL